MWKYLILNTLWMSMLLLVQFFGSAMDQMLIFGAILLLAVFLAVKGVMDPVAWFYYLTFSVLFFFGARYFREWAFGRLNRLRIEVKESAGRYSLVKNVLEAKTKQTRFLEQRSDEIVEFYGQIKDLSRSLDHVETFIVFCESLAEYFDFEVVKLALFGPRVTHSIHPDELFELKGRELKNSFDRNVYLKDRVRMKGQVYPTDQKVYAAVFENKPLTVLQRTQGVIAYPIRIHEEVFAILTIVGLRGYDDPLYTILIERFNVELQRVKLYESVQRLAITDGLTGIFARHYLTERMEGELDRSKRFQLSLSFLMIDIDFFKHFNDEYGHLVGDMVLKQVAQAIKKSVREVDFVGRWGGEEFGVGLVETDEGRAFLVAERIRRSIHDKVFKVYDEELKVDVSIGCATLNPTIHSVEALVETADAALYQAKRLGRNRVCVASG